jgi:hypothetical protein
MNSTPAAGPIAAPRVINQRRVRAGSLALATMLLALGAALSGLALVSVARTANYLAVAKAVPIGAEIVAEDLKTVELRLGSGLSAIPARDINAVVGKRAAVALVPGTLLVRDALTDKELIGPGQAQIGLGVKKANLPATSLHPGDSVLIVAINTNKPENDTTPPQQFPATVVDANEASNTIDDTVLIHLAVAVELAPTIVAFDDVALVLRPRD